MLRAKLSVAGGDLIMAQQRVRELEMCIVADSAFNQRTTQVFDAASELFPNVHMRYDCIVTRTLLDRPRLRGDACTSLESEGRMHACTTCCRRSREGTRGCTSAVSWHQYVRTGYIIYCLPPYRIAELQEDCRRGKAELQELRGADKL